MVTLDLLAPWLAVVALLFPLFYLERWIHQHLYGVGWLLTQDKERATLLYYLILLPGVFLHEFTQWVIAGALKLKTTKIKFWPRPQTNGTLRYDFVRLARNTGRIPAAIVAGAPTVVGIAVVLFISQTIFDVQRIPLALQTGELKIVAAELQRLFGTPDFWVWLYLLFAVGNAMMPPPSEEQDWRLLLIIFGAVTVFLFVIGLTDETIRAAVQEPVNRILRLLTVAFSTILALDLFIGVSLALFELVLMKVTGKRASYPRSAAGKVTRFEPGGESALPPDQIPERITERRLPIPPPPKRNTQKAIPASTAAPHTESASSRLAVHQPDSVADRSSSDAGQLPLHSTPGPLWQTAPRQGSYTNYNKHPEPDELPDDEATLSSDEGGDDDGELHYEPLDDMP